MSQNAQKPKILLARAVFPDLLAELEKVAIVQSNQNDHLWNAVDLKAALADKDAAIVTGSERIDAVMLKASPQLKIVSNILFSPRLIWRSLATVHILIFSFAKVKYFLTLLVNYFEQRPFLPKQPLHGHQLCRWR